MPDGGRVACLGAENGELKMSSGSSAAAKKSMSSRIRLLKRFLAATVFAIAMPCAAQAADFTNGDFETGTPSSWTLGGGSWTLSGLPGPGDYPVPSDYLPGGSHYDATYEAITVTSAGTDAITGLSTVYAGSHSIQVNDSNNNDSVSVISQTVTNYTATDLYFAYAAVLESSHGTWDSDAFILTLTDDTTGTTLYSININSASTYSSGVTWNTYAGGSYTDWTAVAGLFSSLDISGGRPVI
jgi:hypothetical protein